MRSHPRNILLAVVAIVASTSLINAQMPGVPILQNAWASPGAVAAVNLVGGSEGSIYAAAASWTPSSARLQLSAGAGIRSVAGSGSSSVYGVRVAVPLSGSSASFGFGAFAGIGAGTNGSMSPVDSSASTTMIPVGAALGWRFAIGATRGFSVYATPSYVFLTGGSKNTGLVRTALGVDFGVTKAIGITAGTEFGQNRPKADGGPSGTLYGLGLSYAIGRR